MIKPPTVKNFIKSVYVCSTHGPSYMLDMRFLTPGRYFFNEELANQDVAIPEKVVRLSTRKRHALSEKGGEKKSEKESEKKSEKDVKGEQKNEKTEEATQQKTTQQKTTQQKTTSSPAHSRGRK